MARVKVCKRCRRENPVGEPVCLNTECDSDQFVLYPGDGHEPTPDGNEIESDETTRAAVGVVLQCPWGEEAISGRLPLGRDPEFSPVASRLDAFENISRRHAELSIDGRAVRLQDFQSMNGTFVNGQRIEPFVVVPLSDGDEIRLGKDVRLRLRVSG